MPTEQGDLKENNLALIGCVTCGAPIWRKVAEGPAQCDNCQQAPTVAFEVLSEEESDAVTYKHDEDAGKVVAKPNKASKKNG